MNVVSYGATQNSPYTIQEITRMARNPMQYIKPLRQWAKWAYYSNGTVTTAIDSLISLHSLDYVVVVKPKKAGGSRKKYRSNIDKMNSVLRSMRYKEVIRDGLFHNANEGMYVAYMETRTIPVDDRLALTDYDVQVEAFLHRELLLLLPEAVFYGEEEAEREARTASVALERTPPEGRIFCWIATKSGS